MLCACFSAVGLGDKSGAYNYGGKASAGDLKSAVTGLSRSARKHDKECNIRNESSNDSNP